MKTRIALLSEMGLPRPYTRSRPLRIVEADLADPGPGEMRIAMKAAGLCHSDLSSVNGSRPRAVPLALGHEGAGVVDDVGPGVTRFAPGDHVVLVFVPSCGHCVPCAEGRPAICQPAALAAGNGTLLKGGKRISVQGMPVDHHIGVSAFSDQIVVDQGSCVKIDRNIPFDQAALLGCAVLTGAGAVLNSGQLRAGQSCAVVGLGGVGLAGLLGAIAAGARPVLAIDLAKDKRDFALELGANIAVNPGEENAVEKVLSATSGGVDVAVEVAGSARALRFAFDITRRGGIVATAGLPDPTENVELPAALLTVSEKTVRGSYVGSCVPLRDIPRFAAMMMAGRLPIDRLMTHRIRLDQINEGFERLAAGKAIRQIIVFD